MYVFGGCTATHTTFNDLWRFHLGTHEWTRLLTTGTYPSPKAYASMVSWKNYLIMFGGWTHPSVYPLHQQWVLYNELHVYDIMANRWTALYYPGCPPQTAGHTATIQSDIMVMVGGLQKKEGTSISTIDVYCLDMVNECWFKPVMSDSSPMPRYGHSQIKIDERHILVIAGCGGSNKLYNDVWLLTIPDDIYDRNTVWIWNQIKVEGAEHIPPQLWYSPACKVGESVVVLSTGTTQNSCNIGGTMSQLLVPGMMRRQQAWVPPQEQIAAPIQRVDLPVQNPRSASSKEVNINGQRGILNHGARALDIGSSSDENDDLTPPLPRRSRPHPSIRPNANCDHERRLELLSQMQVRLRNISRPQENPPAKHPCRYNLKTKPVVKTVAQVLMIPHVLNIRDVLINHTVIWIQTAAEDKPLIQHGNPPLPRLLYSLLLGRGHLIMFGGIPNDPTGGQNQEVASNSVTFITAPSYCFNNL